MPRLELGVAVEGEFADTEAENGLLSLPRKGFVTALGVERRGIGSKSVFSMGARYLELS
jgi:hypothetical protein